VNSRFDVQVFFMRLGVFVLGTLPALAYREYVLMGGELAQWLLANTTLQGLLTLFSSVLWIWAFGLLPRQRLVFNPRLPKETPSED
jgi:hypothetical protein